MAKAPKMTLPAVNLDLTLTAGKMKAITAAASGKSTEYIVKVDQLRTLPGFNVRVRETEDYRAHLDGLKQSIRENGFYANKPLAGYIGKEGDEDVIYVTDGHTRLDAVNEINDEALNAGEEIEGLPVVLKPADSTLADLTIALVQDNSGRPLTPYEMGVVVQRLQNLRDPEKENAPLYDKSEIAKKLSVTERYIDDLNVLVDAPAKVRDAVLRGTVSSTLAIQELRRDPKKAEERLTAAVEKATASGKTKATKKDIGGSRMKTVKLNVSLATGTAMGDVLKSIAKQIRDVVPHAGKDDGDGLLVDGSLVIMVSVPAPEKPAKAEKKAKRKQTVEKPSKANGGVGGAKKKAPAKAEDNDGADEVTSDEQDGDPVKLPPTVGGDAGNDDADDI